MSNRWPLLTVPVMNDEFSRCPAQYAEALEKSGAGMVFLAMRRSFDPDRLEEDFRRLAENIRALRERGFEVGCWLQAFGFGNPLPEGERADYEKITGMDGRTCGDAFCPTDPRYTAFMADLVRRAARAGAKVIMLDDDLCLNIRPGLGCACRRHMALFSARMGQTLARDQLKALIYTGAPTAHRRAWLQLMGETLEDFCRAMRRAADEVDPGIRMGFCAGYTSWDMEGADALALTRILAGKNRPFLRLSGAPYWAEMRRFSGQTMPHIVEFARMQQAWCEAADVDFFTENDSYPRPRYRIPAALMETFDFCMAAAGCRQQLKYLMDYFSRPDYETGYLLSHLRHRDVIRETARAMDGLPAAGIYVHEDMRRLASMTLPENAPDIGVLRAASFSASSALLSGLGLATAYQNGGGIAAAFGDSGRTVPLSGQKGYILDGAAALEMQRRGVDVGLRSISPRDTAPVFEYFPQFDDRIELNWLDTAAGSLFYRAGLDERARVLSEFRGGGEACPASYFYRGPQGTPFLVLLFRADTMLAGGSLFRSYYRQAQLLDAARRMGAPLPAAVRKEPGAYLICRMAENRLGIALCNFSLDEMVQPRIELAGTWREARFIGCEGRLDGDALMLADIPPYGFAAAILSSP